MPDLALSDLQQFILALAAFHRINAYRDEGDHPDVYAYEVLAVRWRFRTQDRRQLQVWERRTHRRPLLAKVHGGDRYQAARVSTSKAFHRLHARGLARRGSYQDAVGQRSLGLVLTAAGIPAANRALDTFAPQWQATYEAMQARERARR
jgi:hypothetical protein